MRISPLFKFNTKAGVHAAPNHSQSNTVNLEASAPPRVPALKDPDKPRIDVKPADHLEVEAPKSISDQALYKFVVSECFRQARDARSKWEPGWKISLEYHGSNQWWGYDNNTRKFVDYAAKDPNPLRFSSTNLIRPRIETVGSMVTQSSPESQPVPLTKRPIDREAATEARSVIANYNRQYDNKNQIRRMVDWAMTHTSVFLKTTFEPSAMADKPVFAKDKEKTSDAATGLNALFQQLTAEGAMPPSSAWQGTPSPIPPQGMADQGKTENEDDGPEITGVEHAQIGDIVERIVPGTNIYLDPSCTRYEDARWLIHAEVYPLSWYQERFENGFAVKADAGTGTSGKATGDMPGIGTSYGLGAGDPGVTGQRVNADVATCYEMWILPKKTPLFPLGAYIVCAGGQVLKPRNADGGSPTTSEAAWAKALGAKLSDEESVNRAKKKIPGSYLPWPYTCTTEFPFVELGFDDNPDSPYARSLVQDMIEPQQDYNRTRTRIRELLEKSKAVMLTPDLSFTGAERFEDYATYQKVRYNPAGGAMGGGQPQWFQSPPVPAEHFNILQVIERTLDDIAGIHDPNFRGIVPAGVTSGVAIDTLKQGDASRLSRFASRVERMVMKRDTWRIRHAGQFFDEPRLMGLDDTGNPGDAAANAQSFKALSDGGQVRVIVAPGSSLSETPDARNRRIMEWYQAGLYGPVGSPAAAQIAIELMDQNDGDIILQHLRDLEAKIGPTGEGQAPPPPTPEEQMQMQREAAQMQMEMETQKEIAVIQAQSAARMQEREAEYLLQQKYGPLLGSPSSKLTPAAQTILEEDKFGVSDLSEAAGHLGSAALAEPVVGAAYGLSAPKEPVLPGQDKPGTSQVKKTP